MTSISRSASGWTKSSAGGVVFVEPDPAPEGARVWFFTRLGGVSEPPFDSLNVSSRYGDSSANVEENISRMSDAMEGRPVSWVRQVAGDRVARVVEGGFAGEADALLTEEPGLSLTVGVADCVPVALVGSEGVGMVHSGWRGTLSGVSGKAVREMSEESRDIKAYIGPCIRDCCYEVSEGLASEFRNEFGERVAPGRMLSLPGAIIEDLRRSGVREVHDLGLCTGCHPELFFSYRMQKPVTGRGLAAVAKLGS